MMLQDKKTRLFYLISLSLLLSSLEYLIPKPFPFLKLGLANLPLIFSLPFLSFNEYIILSICKALLQAMIGGTIISPFFIISLAGSLATALTMFISFRLLKRNTFVGISILGAIASNTVQVAVAATLIYGKSIFVALPLILALGLISSTILGYLSNIFYRESTFIKQCTNLTLMPVETFITKFGSEKENKKKGNKFYLLLAFVFIILSFVISKTEYLAGILLLSYIIQIKSKRKLKLSYPIILLLSMILLSLIEPNGKVIFKYFTQGALLRSLSKAIRILILIASSQILVGCSNIKIGPIKSIFSLSGILLSRINKTKGSLINRLDDAIIGN